MSKEVALSDHERSFIDCLVSNGGHLVAAAKESGYAPAYAYALRKRLSKQIAEAAQEYLAMQSVRAAHVVLDHMDKDMPNPIHLAAAKDVLDRAGVVKRPSEDDGPVIRANIFILPEKRPIQAIEVEYQEINERS